MKTFSDFLQTIDNPDKKQKLAFILNHIQETFPHLQQEIKWNAPMFSDHGTFIIGFSIAKGHISVAPEAVVISKFKKELEAAGYVMSKEIFRIKWTDEVDFGLMEKIVAYNIEDKKDMTKYWR